MAKASDKRLSLAAVGELPTAALRKAFKEIVGKAPPRRGGRDFLIGNIAWHLQAKGRKIAPQALRPRILGQLRKSPTPAQPSYKPGTRLVREWQGETYEVTVLETGFAWRGTRYRSLSEIAREITGARWSGPRFFGLK